MHIVFLNDSMCGGGAERAMANIVNELSKTNNIHLISLEDSFCVNLNSNITTSYFNKNINSRVKKFFGLLIDAYKLKQFIKKNKQSVVVSFQYRSNFINIISKLIGSKHKSVVSERNYPEKSLEYLPFFSFLLKKLYPLSDIVTCNASDTKELFTNKYGFSNVKLIFNGYNKKEILRLASMPLEDKYKSIFKKNVVLNIGRLTQQKGQAYLLEAFALLDSEKYHLLLIGKGDLEKSLHELAKKLKIEKRVFFVGYQENPYVFIEKSKVFAFSSLYEGFPNALAEALICKTAIASFNFKSGANDLISKKNLVDIGDITYLARVIEEEIIEKDTTLNIYDVANEYDLMLRQMINK